jgi:large-conductance mechanosensitive channel
MKKLLYASLIACVLTVLPLMALRIQSESGIVNSLKWASSNILLPGTYFGFLAAGGRIDDISFFVADSINFLLYAVVIYLMLAGWEKRKAKSIEKRTRPVKGNERTL